MKCGGMQKVQQNNHRDLPYFYQPNLLEVLALTAEESSHAVRVLRLRVGDRVRVTDGRGHLYEASIMGGTKEVVLGGLEEISIAPSPIPPLHIAIAPTKNIDRIEWMVEKLCEAGLSRLSIVNTAHTVRRSVNLSRIEKVIISAMKQSRKLYMTDLYQYGSVEEFLDSPLGGQRFIGYCGEGFERRELAHAFTKGCESVFMIGPEGDFSGEEVRAAVNMGFVPATFGRERLRTETAGLYAGMLHHILNT